MKLFTCDTLPAFCPYCGNAFKWTDYGSRSDFYAMAAHTCLNCHADYVHVPADRAVRLAAELGSDIAQYVK